MNDVPQMINSIEFQNYKDSTPIVSELTIPEVVTAGLIARLNIAGIWTTGEGKTQLENDVRAIFGNRGFFEQGRHDLTIREMLTRFNFNEITDRQELKRQIKTMYNPTTGKLESFVPVYDKGKTKLSCDENAVSAFKTASSISPDQLIEITSRTRFPCYVIDELTRCPPVVQNQFFNFFDGFIPLMRKISSSKSLPLM